MIKLLRHFSLISAVAILAVTVVLINLYRQNAINQIVEMAESQNVDLARSFANTIWPRFSAYVTGLSGLDGDALRARPETRQIHEALKTLTAGLSVLKVEIYNLDGLTVFSSQASQIGEDKSNNPGFFAAALDGRPASKRTHKDTFSAFSGEVVDRELVESYVPIRRGDGPVEAVFELYSDVTPLIVKIDRSTARLSAGLVLVFGLLYLVLYLIVRRANLILKRQYIDVLQGEKRIAAKNASLKREIADRKQAEQALRESEERFRAVVNNSPTKIHIKDLDGRYTMINRQSEILFGVTEEEAKGKTSRDIFTKEVADSFMGHDQAVIESGQTIEDEEEWLRDDGVHTYLTVKFPIRDADGEIMAVGVIGTDITERKLREQEKEALERELQQAGKMEAIGQLAGGIAHEINTPVQYIGDNLRFLDEACRDLGPVVEKYQKLARAARDKGVLEDEVREAQSAADEADLDYLLDEFPKATRQSIEGTGRVADIVLAMKEFSHPSMKEKVAADINHAIQSTVTVSRNEWKHVAEMELDLDGTLAPVMCLAGEVNQVFLNLIINAAHAIAAKGGDGKERITVSTRKDGDWVEIRVADTGTGIPENVRDKIFNPFFTTKEVDKGTGQGLAICHDVVVHKHGGKIFFETEMGKGTTFVVRLPIDAQEKASEAA